MTVPVDHLQREAAGEHVQGTSGHPFAYGTTTPRRSLVENHSQGGYGMKEMAFERIAAWVDGLIDDAECVELIREGFRTFYKCGGAVSLERCMYLPASKARFNTAEQNYHLRHAAMLLASDAGVVSSTALAAAVNSFLVALWPKWKARREPPDDASQVHAHLFAAARATDGRLPTSVKHCGRIINPLLMGGLPDTLRDRERGRALDWDARRHWLESEAVRLEFGTFECYRAWRRAVDAGRVKFSRRDNSE